MSCFDSTWPPLKQLPKCWGLNPDVLFLTLPNTHCPAPIPTVFCSKSIKFRRSAAVSLAALLAAFPECCVYEMVAPTLLRLASFAGSPGAAAGGNVGKADPIMEARAVSCLAAAWPLLPPPRSKQSTNTTYVSNQDDGKEERGTGLAATREVVYTVQRRHATSLTRALTGAIRRKVWSVRVPILHALAAIVSRSYAPSAAGTAAAETDETGGESKMPPVLTGALLVSVVEAVEVGAQDAKYSQVRFEGCLPSYSEPRATCVVPIVEVNFVRNGCLCVRLCRTIFPCSVRLLHEVFVYCRNASRSRGFDDCRAKMCAGISYALATADVSKEPPFIKVIPVASASPGNTP